MYIICETIAGNDPRYTSTLERIYSHWIYTAYYSPTPVDLELYDATEVSESVARSMKFGNVNKGKIGLRTGSLAHEEVFGNSTEADGVKTYYYINESEEAETVELLKVESPLSKFPSSSFDLTVVMNKDAAAAGVITALNTLKQKEIKSKSLVDIFVMNDTQKAVTIRTVFEDSEKTLAPETIKDLEHKIVQVLEKAGFPLRS